MDRRASNFDDIFILFMKMEIKKQEIGKSRKLEQVGNWKSMKSDKVGNQKKQEI